MRFLDVDTFSRWKPTCRTRCRHACPSGVANHSFDPISRSVGLGLISVLRLSLVVRLQVIPTVRKLVRPKTLAGNAYVEGAASLRLLEILGAHFILASNIQKSNLTIFSSERVCALWSFGQTQRQERGGRSAILAWVLLVFRRSLRGFNPHHVSLCLGIEYWSFPSVATLKTAYGLSKSIGTPLARLPPQPCAVSPVLVIQPGPVRSPVTQNSDIDPSSSACLFQIQYLPVRTSV